MFQTHPDCGRVRVSQDLIFTPTMLHHWKLGFNAGQVVPARLPELMADNLGI